MLLDRICNSDMVMHLHVGNRFLKCGAFERFDKKLALGLRCHLVTDVGCAEWAKSIISLTYLDTIFIEWLIK